MVWTEKWSVLHLHLNKSVNMTAAKKMKAREGIEPELKEESLL